jgi:hypothetical protein
MRVDHNEYEIGNRPPLYLLPCPLTSALALTSRDVAASCDVLASRDVLAWRDANHVILSAPR